MQDNDIVLSVKNVSKSFEMYEKPVHRLAVTLLLIFAYFSSASIFNSSYSARTSQCLLWMLVGLLMAEDRTRRVIE